MKTDISKYYKLEMSLNESIGFDYDRSLNTFLEMINMQLDNDWQFGSLSENANYMNYFSEYVPLIEAVDVVKDASTLDASMSKNDIKKKIDNLMNWWFKIEPNKKFKTLHTVLKVGCKIMYLVAFLYGSNIALVPFSKTNLYKRIPNKTFNVFGKAASSRDFLLTTVIDMIIVNVLVWLRKISNDKEFEVNKADCEANIKSITKQIDQLDNQIDNCKDEKENKALEKARNELSAVLRELYKFKRKNRNRL